MRKNERVLKAAGRWHARFDGDAVTNRVHPVKTSCTLSFLTLPLLSPPPRASSSGPPLFSYFRPRLRRSLSSVFPIAAFIPKYKNDQKANRGGGALQPGGARPVLVRRGRRGRHVPLHVRGNPHGVLRGGLEKVKVHTAPMGAREARGNVGASRSREVRMPSSRYFAKVDGAQETQLVPCA